jgi:hypothetical protein
VLPVGLAFVHLKNQAMLTAHHKSPDVFPRVTGKIQDREYHRIFPGILLLLIVLVLLSLVSCRVRLIADRDEALISQLLATSKAVDAFYLQLMDTPAEGLAFSEFLGHYNNIELEIRSLWLQCEAKPLNSESARIAKIILDKWLKYKNQHRSSNTYNLNLAPIHRDRFQELFIALLNVEKAKEISE